MLFKNTAAGFLAAGLILLTAAPLGAMPVYTKTIGNGELELGLDPYYSAADLYIPLTGKAIPCLDEKNEIDIYKRLLLSPIPRFLVAEVSVNPGACLGAYIKKNEPGIYDRLSLSPSYNIVQGLTAGFEEPWAGSLFLGNVVSYSLPGVAACAGKGYLGGLLAGGNYHTKDNELIEDDWLQAELKFKGDRVSAENKMNWGVRFGAKFHRNPYIKDVYYFSVRRDRLDYGVFAFSLLRNSGIEYTFDVENDSGKIIRHYFRISKKMPLWKWRAGFGISAGFVWEGADKYTGPLARPGNGSLFQFLLRPTLEF
jgi:hypothetical protein